MMTIFDLCEPTAALRHIFHENYLFLDGWMNVPLGIPNCPPGLEYLTTIDQLLVKQKVELLEAFTGFETNNKFTIKNSLGQKVRLAELFCGITCQQFGFSVFLIQFCVGILGC